jgi:hypothetical protein
MQFDADGVRELQKDFQKLQRETLKLAAANKKLERASKKSNAAARQGAKAAVASVKSLVVQYAGASAALALWNDQRRVQIALDAKASSTTTSLAASQQNFINAQGGVTPEEKERRDAVVNRIAKESGVESVATVLDTMTTVLGGVQNNFELAARVTTKALELSKFTPGDVPIVGGALADLASLIGDTSNKGLDKSAAILQTAFANSRLVGLGQSKEFATAAGGAISADTSDDKEGAVIDIIALLAAVTTSVKLSKGERARSSGVRFAQTLGTFLPEDDVVESGRVVREGTGLETLDERIDFLRTNKDERDRFLKTFSTEADILPVFKSFLSDPNSDAFKNLDAARASVSSDTTGIDQLKANLANDPVLKTAAKINEFTLARENRDVANVQGSRDDIGRKAIDDILDLPGEAILGLPERLFDRFNALTSDVLGADMVSEAESIAERRLRTGNLSEEQKKLLQIQIDLLRSVDSGIREQNQNRNNSGAIQREHARDPE